jgi:hypothetical protein
MRFKTLFETKCTKRWRRTNPYLIDNTSFGVSEEGGGVSLGEPLRLALQLVVVLLQGDRLADDDVVTGNAKT